MDKEKKFKVEDRVDVWKWAGSQGKNWIIVGFSSQGNEAHIIQIGTGVQTFVLLSDLVHQEKKVSNG